MAQECDLQEHHSTIRYKINLRISLCKEILHTAVGYKYLTVR